MKIKIFILQFRGYTILKLSLQQTNTRCVATTNFFTHAKFERFLPVI